MNNNAGRVILAGTLSAALLVASCDKQNASSSTGATADVAPPAVRYGNHIPAGGVAPPAGELRNPHAGDADSAKAGERLFASMNCDGCHGGGASGWVAPSLADGRWRYGGEDSAIFSSIFYGRPKGMPAYGGAVGQEGVWMLVTYLKSLPVPDVVPTQSWIEPSAAAAQPNRNEGKAASPAAEPVKAAATPAARLAAQSPKNLQALLQINGCTACHSIDNKIVGPAFKEVAQKYRGQAGAEAKLFASAKNGSSGVWGPIPMPPNAAVKDEDVHAIVKQILSLK